MAIAPLQRGRADYCHYIFHHGARVCPHEDQDRLLQHFLDRAANGSHWAANMLQMTPCDVWPFIRGRTVWLMGDSITQVLPWPLLKDPLLLGPTHSSCTAEW